MKKQTFMPRILRRNQRKAFRLMMLSLRIRVIDDLDFKRDGRKGYPQFRVKYPHMRFNGQRKLYEHRGIHRSC